MPLSSAERSRLVVEAAQGDPQAQVILDRDRQEREGTTATTPGTGQTPIWTPPAPVGGAQPFTTTPTVDPILAPQPQRPVTPTPPPSPTGRPQADPNIAPLNPLMQEPPPPRDMGPDPYANYPMQQPAQPPGFDPYANGADPYRDIAAQGIGMGPAPTTAQLPPQPPPQPDWTPPAMGPRSIGANPYGGADPYGLQEQSDPYANYPMQPPAAGTAPGAGPPPGPRYMGSNPQPFTETPGTPATPGGTPPAVNFNAMNAPTPPGLPGFRLPPATVTEAATDPDRQGRSDWGDDLVMLGLGMMAGADNPGASLFGALGTGGLAMMANRRERERDASKAAERQQEFAERQADRQLRIDMQQAGFSFETAIEVERERGRNRRAAMREDQDPEDLQEDALALYGRLYENELAPRVGPDGFTMVTPTPQEALDRARQGVDAIYPGILPPGGGRGLPEDATELVDGEIYATAQGPRTWRADPNNPDGGAFE